LALSRRSQWTVVAGRVEVGDAVRSVACHPRHAFRPLPTRRARAIGILWLAAFAHRPDRNPIPTSTTRRAVAPGSTYAATDVDHFAHIRALVLTSRSAEVVCRTAHVICAIASIRPHGCRPLVLDRACCPCPSGTGREVDVLEQQVRLVVKQRDRRRTILHRIL